MSSKQYHRNLITKQCHRDRINETMSSKQGVCFMFLNDILARFENNIEVENITDQSEIILKNRVLQNALKEIIAFTANLAHPAQGYTYQRWQIFAQVAATNLTLAKWFESHCDALSILYELNIQHSYNGVWAVWAAEGSSQPLICHSNHCSGEKLWCSGAEFVEYGLCTYKNENAQSQLCIIDMNNDGIVIDHSKWQAVGMKDTRTATLTLNDVAVENVGEPDDYLNRVGFWHGAAGVAACWFGATVRIASFLEKEFKRKSTAFNAMYFGEVVAHLAMIKKLFKALAEQIDQQPDVSHELEIRVLRFHVEQTAKKVIDLVGNALGARPFCENAIFAQLVSDLPVFLRQSHAAYELERIAHLSLDQSNSAIDANQEQNAWML